MDRRVFVRLAAVCLVASAATPLLATAPKVATVPWNPAGGIYSNPHSTYSGYNMLLMGVAEDHDGDADIVSYEWIFGDGGFTGPIAIGPTAGPVDLEARHVYVGVDNQPFTAQLRVCDVNNDCTTDNFRVIVKTLTLDIEVNIAIDEGLWNLHRTQSRFTDGATGEPMGQWTNSGYTAGATSSPVQAFLINEHLTPAGGADPDEDPYTDTVVRGINRMLSLLVRVNTAIQTCAGPGSFDPDSNGNGYGLGVNSSRPIYESGQVMDALAATRTPAATAVTGVPEVLGQTYEQIATDMGDYYSYCMDDSGGDAGGWRYSCNSDADNSAAQWGAIGNLGIEAFGIPTQACVKSQNLNIWLVNSRFSGGTLDGCFGYTGRNCISNCMATTPSGMVQLAMDDVAPGDARWDDAEACMCRNWLSLWNFPNGGNLYAYYALAKAMRSAVGGTDDTLDPCGRDWYAELAQDLVNRQFADGSWRGNFWVGSGPLATSWAIIILKPTLVCPAPVASCDADPSTTTIDCPVAFDGSNSLHPGADNPLPGCGTEIVSYDWDFDDGNTATGDMVEHAFGANGTYNVSLTVTDDVGIASTTVCPVQVDPPPVDPDADPDGPYDMCLNLIAPSVILDGTASRDPDNSPCAPGNGIVSCAWELDFAEFPPDFDDAFGCTVDATSFYRDLGAGVYDVGLRVTDDEGVTNDDFTTVRVRDDCDLPPCPPDAAPNSQGYWHRQCLGLPESEGGIDPGRHGRGPKSPTEPGFAESLMPQTDDILEELGFFGELTCDGMDADPASDKCEQAMKQFTALLLNVVSGRISEGCEVDPSLTPCSATTVAGLVNEIADLIHGGMCNDAKTCAAAMNEGDSLINDGGGGSAAPRDTPISIAPYDPPVTIVAAPSRPGARDTRRSSDPVARFEDLERGGWVLYYLVPDNYVSNDPLVRIMSVGPASAPAGMTRREAFAPTPGTDPAPDPKPEQAEPGDDAERPAVDRSRRAGERARRR